jgi:hypothetical protein
MARVIQVIETEEKRGKGVEDDPIRGVTQYWSLDGELLAENDPVVTDRPTPPMLVGAKLLRDIYDKQAAAPGGHQ